MSYDLIIQKWFDEDLDAPAASGVFTLALDAGSYSSTGAALTALVDRLLSLDAGAYNVSGLDATLARVFNLSLDPGSYALTGAAAVFGVERVLALNPGAYVILGVDATLETSGTPATPATVPLALFLVNVGRYKLR